MIEPASNSFSLPRYFKTFIAVMALLSFLAGYLFSQLIYKTNDFYLQRTDRLLTMQENLDEAAISLGRQIQEWKNMLLRANNEDLFNKHRQAFMFSSYAVQESLLRTKTSMLKEGMDTSEIDQLLSEHKLLLSDYLLAKNKLNPQRADSYHAADIQVVGVDRNLQRHFTVVKHDIEEYSKAELNGSLPKQVDSYLLIGLLGSSSLLIMSLLGVIFSSYFR